MLTSRITNLNINSEGQEFQNHNTAQFPITCYDVELPDLQVPWHFHDELEIGIVVKGSMTIEGFSRAIEIHEGEAYFMNTGHFHRASTKDYCHLHSLVFHPRLVGGSLDSAIWLRYVQPLISDKSFVGIPLSPVSVWQNRCISYGTTAWSACVKEADGFEINVRENLTRFLFDIHRQQGQFKNRLSMKSIRNSERMRLMYQFIQEHYAEPVTLTDIAAAAAISESECMRCFKSCIGTSPLASVKNYRLQQAAYLLRVSDKKISTIASECGFQEMSYFAKTFRETYGVTPSDYRTK